MAETAPNPISNEEVLKKVRRCTRAIETRMNDIRDNKSLFLAYFTHGDLLNVKEQYEKGILNSNSIPRSKGTDSKTIDCISSFYIGGTDRLDNPQMDQCRLG